MTEVETFVRPFYMRFLRGNFLREEPAVRASFFDALRGAAAKVDDVAITRLLNCGGWRERISAAWFIGLLELRQFEPRISALLLKSEVCFAGQGYCFALARFRSATAASTLESYLAQYLPVGERQFDQEWAIGALHVIDPTRANAVPRDTTVWQPLRPERGVSDFAVLMQHAEEGWSAP